MTLSEKVTHKNQILVVEDNHSDIELLTATLNAEFEVVAAVDGVFGLEKAKEIHPDLIISDVRMPRMSGFTMLKNIRSNPELAAIPVILLTALDEPIDKVHGYDLLADLYLTKPIDTSELFAAVKSLIRLHQKREETPNYQTSPGIGIAEDDSLFLRRLIESIHANIDNSEFKVDDLAADAYVTRRQLERRLKKLEYLTPAEYIRQVRLEQARKLIESGLPNSIADLAHRVGFRDAKHFSKCFKSFYGVQPTLQG